MNVIEYIKDNILLLDGAMGTVLQNSGISPGKYPEAMNIDHADVVASVHDAYMTAGSKLVLTNTFGASAHKMAGCQYTPRQVITAGVQLAKKVRAKHGGYVALDIGPLGRLLEPMGTMTFEQAYEDFAMQVKAGVAAGADLIFIETMTDLYEVKAAVLAAKENSNLPVFTTMSFEQNMHTFAGTALSSMAITLDALGVDALGINCSLGPVEMLPMAKELKKWTDKPLIIKPNAGLPCLVNDKTVYNITKEDFAAAMEEIMALGVNIVGGCCGTTPEMLKFFFDKAKQRTKTDISARQPVSAVCSSGRTVVIDGVRIIGERINPTGKALFKKALETGDMDYIARQAVEQMNAGAHILDVNVGHLGVDEKEMMIKTVKKIQSVCNLPLQIDSSSREVIEAGLRVCNGKAIVNSVNGEQDKLDTILPIAKKYGAAVLGLTLDENGIPDTAQERFAIAEKILANALAHGIRKEDVFIDCLTLASSAQQEGAVETLRAVEMVTKQLGLKTTLGVSNISFGLPNRQLLNSSFMTMAMYCGLKMPIINPNATAMTDAVYAFNQLTGADVGGSAYISRFNAEKAQKTADISVKTNVYSMEDLISLGLDAEVKKFVKSLLKVKQPLEIVQEKLIPALDKVGKDYENGKIFLPQLMASAEAAKKGFDAINEYIVENGSGNFEKKGPVIIATVKGDVHDIGKNIVKTVLENYGYEVIDLGKDVPPQAVVDAAMQHGAQLVGLSALMTTTVKAMEQTITLLKQSADIPVMVGGAVLTADFARQIGADYYASDAQAAVSIAKKVIK
ncbi:MAG: homocysteine S-methyltransferase family protein [Oscillospiraceae bacterium]|nr:homocysteine S-methyltransferase family protein [Oscillospiraceae bacterium]